MSDTNTKSRIEEKQYGMTRSIVYSLIIITIFFVLAEGSIRTWAYFFRGEYERYDTSTKSFVLIPGDHKTGRGVININSDGFVGKELEKSGKDLFRIFTVGDSTTFGDGNVKNTYPALLENLLKENNKTKKRIEVVNGGVEGLNSEMALLRLNSKGPMLSPDVITIYIGWNDLMKSEPYSQQTDKPMSGVVGALDKLWITKGIRKLMFFYVRPNLAPPKVGINSRTGQFDKYVPSLYQDNLKKLITSARGLGAKVLLVNLPTILRIDMTLQDIKKSNIVFPYYTSAYAVGDLLDLLATYNKSIATVAKELNVPLIDLSSRFTEIKNIKPYFYDTMHASKKGRVVIANKFYESLLKFNLLPK